MRTPYLDAKRRLREAESDRLALAKASSSVGDPRAHALPGWQQGFARDKAQFREANTGRRAGKTTVFADDILAESWENPNGMVLYLNTTRDRANRTIWEELKQAAVRNNMPYVPNEGRLSLRGPDNRWIFASGGETKKHIDKWKGTLPPLVAAYLDEGQDWEEEVLEYAIARVLLPALADRGGRLTVGGTPGAVPEGFYYRLTQSPEWSHHTGTMFDNPAVKFPRQLLEAAMRLRQVAEDDPTIQREFFGRWVRDTAILVFGALDDELNAYDVMPEGRYLFAGGVDGGYVDDAAIATLAWLEEDPEFKTYLKSCETFGHRGAIEIIERVKAAFEPLGARITGIAADPAAGMKNIAHDVWAKHGIEMDPAEKDDKVGGCKLLASAIASRELLLPRGHRLFKSLRRVQWDPEHRGEKLKGHTPDDVDALLYGYRKAYPWIVQRKPEPPKSYEEERLDRILAKQEADGGHLA